VIMPVGTRWPLIGEVIFTPCAIDDDNCDAGSGRGFVTVVLPVIFGGLESAEFVHMRHQSA
jgi:hypothetical protein